MASPFQCSLCSHHFTKEAQRLPMVVSCGHTLCGDCISRMATKMCPYCRVPFASPVPNLVLLDIMLAEALKPTSSQAQSREATETQISTITAKVVALQMEVNRREKAITKAQHKAHTDRQELKKLMATLLALQQSLGLDLTTSVDSIIGADSSTDGGNPDLPVILIKTDNLGDALEMVNFSKTPAVYDFQGQNMKYKDRGFPTITSDGAILRNGRFLLKSDQSLFVDGTAVVVLDAISVFGGGAGVWVGNGGCLTMTACELRDNKTGLYLCGDCTARLTDCEISGGKEHGIYMTSNSSMEGTRVCITGIQGEVLHLVDKAMLDLSECIMRKNPGKPGVVEDEASLVLTRCAVDDDRFQGQFKC